MLDLFELPLEDLELADAPLHGAEVRANHLEQARPQRGA